MSKVIIAITCIVMMFLLNACDPFSSRKNQRFTNNHYIINTTGKRIIHELNFIVPLQYRDSTLYFYSDGLNAKEEAEWNVSFVVGLTGTGSQADMGYSPPFYVYNISDTASLQWNEPWTQYDSTKFLQPFYWLFGRETDTDSEINCIVEYYLIVNDSLLSLMHKDYAMLEKFPEYYGKK